MDLQTLSAEFNLHLSDTQLAQFAHYQALLIEWNQRLNLTRIIEPDDIVLRHFLDSLTCATITGDLNNSSLIDVGTGAGFPGLPLKILYPGLRLTLTDSVAKKTQFLKTVVDALGLENVQVIAERAEVLGQLAEHREQYDWALARAVARMPILAEYLLPLVKPGGAMLAQKGETAKQESAESAVAFETLGGSTPTIHPITLPGVDSVHYLVHAIKIGETPAAYPRRTGRPTKKPLK